MRLLEFDQVDGSTDPEQSVHLSAQIKDMPAPPVSQARPPQPPARTANAAARVFPIKVSNLAAPSQRGPIDLENLQQRIDALEKRIKMRVEKNQASISTPELEQLRQRLVTLERNINNELWAAKQREYTLLEMLARPSLSARIGQYLTRIKSHHLPAIGRCLKDASREWWLDRQPQWWPRFAQAWQESLDKARDF